jgi:CRISPR type IV-associated protein Csf1
MHATHLIFTAAWGRPPREIGESTCGICGLQGAAPYEFSSSFMNWDLVRARALCEACAFCMREAGLRYNSFVCTPGRLQPLGRSELVQMLFSPPEPPFVFCVTRSYKKHNAIRARVNYSRERYHIRMEDLEPEIRPGPHAQIFDAMRRLYLAGITKQELAAGQVSHRKLKSLGLEAWLESAPLLEGIRGTPEMELLLHALTKEVKNDGT